MIRSIKNIFHLFEAILANIIFQFPSHKIKVIGVTGTDGKTTTTSLIYHILKEGRFPVSMISTVYAKVGKKQYDTGLHTTTPSAFNIQKYLSEAVKNGDEFFVLETTAHALNQYRTWGISYHVSVITNVTHEHLRSVKGFDYFLNYRNYLMAKAKLFKQSKIAILNKDDKSYIPLCDSLSSKKIITKTYSLKKPAIYNWGRNLNSPLPGDYNKYNVLAAYAVCDSLNISIDKIEKGIRSFKAPPGRFEIIKANNPTVIIDFAHTINGISELLKTVKETKINDSSRIIHVFGAAGQRDMTKRVLMGKSSGEYADIVILTEEDYRTEDPLKICGQIAEGLKVKGFREGSIGDLRLQKKKYNIIIDRKRAINTAISIAQSKDVIVTTGKGHEKSLCRGKKEIPWNEREIILDSLNRR